MTTSTESNSVGASPPCKVDCPFDLMAFDSAIAKELGCNRTAIHNEKRLQESIACVLTKLGAVFEREYAFGRGERVDFWMPSFGWVMEIKTGKAGLAELRQVGRYLEHSEVKGAILVANRFSERVTTLWGKPLSMIELYRFHV